MARTKVKNGEKSPWGQCLTRPVASNGTRIMSVKERRVAFSVQRQTFVSPIIKLVFQ